MNELDILHLDQISRGDTDLVGMPAASLGELTQAGFPVLPGFVVTAHAYQRFLQENGLRPKITALLREIQTRHDTRQIHTTARRLQQLIINAHLPVETADELRLAYSQIYHHHKGAAFLSIRPSLAGDEAHIAIAEEQATFVNVAGADALIRAIKHVWASLFAAEALDYRHHVELDYIYLAPAVLVQMMMTAEASGVLLTANPLRDQVGDELIIEAVLGLPEPLLSGALSPDRYVISRATKEVIESEVANQPWQLVRATGQTATTRHRAIPLVRRKQPKLSPNQLRDLGLLGVRIHEHLQLPQHVQWAVDAADRWWILDSWPMTLGVAETPVVGSTEQLLARGVAGTMGQACGPVRKIHRASELGAIRRGEIVVAESLGAPEVAQLQQAAGLVLETGGLTSHSLIAARELGIPCVVGAGNALSRIKNGLVITIDGHTATVRRGKVVQALHAGHRYLNNFEPLPATSAKIFVNLADARGAQAAAADSSIDGVGLIRGEFLLGALGVHPRYLFREKKDQLLSRHLGDQLRQIAQAFTGRPVIYRAIDLRTDVGRELEGGDKVEPREANPMLGYRGAARLLREPDLFQLELGVLKNLRENYDLTNLHLMLPFVRTVDEYVRLANLVEAAGLRRAPDFRLWMMVEVPANVISINDFLAAGVDAISLGSSDLTQLLLGVDRDNPKMTSDFQERNSAVVAALAHVIRACRQRNIPVSLSGEAAQTQPALVEDLMEAGLTGLSVSVQAAQETRRLVASIERHILLGGLTQAAHGEAHPIWR